jgi:hypothetical protein
MSLTVWRVVPPCLSFSNTVWMALMHCVLGNARHVSITPASIGDEGCGVYLSSALLEAK